MGAIRELSEKREKLQAFINAQKALISCPRRLHTDLLENIFLACLPAGGISVIRRNSVMSAHVAPLLLCRICSSWRKATMSMPRLWASLHIPVDFILARDTRASAVDNWLKRAAACPLSLSVWDNMKRWQWGETLHSEDDMLALAKSLRTHSLWWHDVVFTDPSPHMAQTLREIDQAPNLASFTLHGSTFLATEPKLLNSPSLRTVNLFSHDDLNIVLEIPLVAWQQLTQLDLQSGSGISGTSGSLSPEV
ncbi:hypothetical protein R3P38DRAFT_3486756 [Favolaschia claudopus]|uniref:F-box domain-containing protein n=1 Tax=Favolaschia claudopus TaxID=2862362 RepID=A0AAV9Z5Z6_9AGAR